MGKFVNLDYFDSKAPLDEILDSIKRVGGAVLEDALDVNSLTLFRDELETYQGATPFGRDDFTGHKTKRTGALVARTPSCRKIVTDSRILNLAHRFLAPYTEKLTVHLTQATTIYPGERPQTLHRDREAFGNHIPPQLEPQFNTLWAITDFTVENGATRFVPGSHQWRPDRKAKPVEIIQAEMTKGSVLIYTGSVLHGGGENKSIEPRLGLNLTYCLAWLRQQENQYLSCPPDIAKELDEELQELLGYTQGTYGLGYFSDPYGAAVGFDPMVPELALGRGPRKRVRFAGAQFSEVDSK